MKYLACLFFTLLLAQNALADNLCDASCELIITFPEGGSITADEAMQITFGSGGELNLGAAGTVNTNPQPLSTDYSAGGVLSLAKGDSIGFDSNGSLVLGAGGNIDAMDMTINTSGGASLQAVGGTEAISLVNLTITGGLNITLHAKTVSVTGTLTIESDSGLILTGESGGVTPSICNVQDPGNATLTVGAGIVDTSSSCSTISAGLSLPIGAATVGIIDPNATLITTGTIQLTPFTGTADGITLVPETLTRELLLTLQDGIELPTDDGNTCTMTAGECVTAAGVKYTVVDGKLIPAATEDSSGQVNPAVLLLLFIMLLSLRYRGYYSRK